MFLLLLLLLLLLLRGLVLLKRRGELLNQLRLESAVQRRLVLARVTVLVLLLVRMMLLLLILFESRGRRWYRLKVMGDRRVRGAIDCRGAVGQCIAKVQEQVRAQVLQKQHRAIDRFLSAKHRIT